MARTVVGEPAAERGKREARDGEGLHQDLGEEELDDSQLEGGFVHAVARLGSQTTTSAIHGPAQGCCLHEGTGGAKEERERKKEERGAKMKIPKRTTDRG